RVEDKAFGSKAAIGTEASGVGDLEPRGGGNRRVPKAAEGSTQEGASTTDAVADSSSEEIHIESKPSVDVGSENVGVKAGAGTGTEQTASGARGCGGRSPSEEIGQEDGAQRRPSNNLRTRDRGREGCGPVGKEGGKPTPR
ncbi:unnamed protein product, partial [Discosporangium mesarthrocarpum]